MEEQTCLNPIEDQRAAALKHYEEASSAIHHWSSFVDKAIKDYNPTAQPSPPEQVGKEWNKPIDGIIHVPDELDPIINKVATQIRFHTISGKSEQETVADIVYICQKFFTD